MPRRVLLPFLALGLLLAALPAALSKPGLPLGLRGDEADYLGAAYSLLEDHDLAFETKDAERVFGQFPYDDQIEFRLQTPPEGGRRYDLPVLYPLLAMPALALLGSNGLLVFNLLLLLAAIWLGRALPRPPRRKRHALFRRAFRAALAGPDLRLLDAAGRPAVFLGMAAFTEGWADERPLPAGAAPWPAPRWASPRCTRRTCCCWRSRCCYRLWRGRKARRPGLRRGPADRFRGAGADPAPGARPALPRRPHLRLRKGAGRAVAQPRCRARRPGAAALERRTPGWAR